MIEYYNQSYTKEQIEVVLSTIQECVQNDRFSISLNENRQENIDFINSYNLSAAKRKNILLRIETDDFCHTLNNIKLGFEHEVLYVFCPQIVLFNFEGEEELVDIYTKFNIIEDDTGNNVVTISFHKTNKPLDYLFR